MRLRESTGVQPMTPTAWATILSSSMALVAVRQGQGHIRLHGCLPQAHLLLGAAALGASAAGGLVGGEGSGRLASPAASRLLPEPSAAWDTTSRRAPCWALSRTKASMWR